LPPGAYTVTVTATNFKTQSFSNIVVVAETPRTLDAHLSTGADTETVTVNGNAIPLLQSADASVSTTIDSQQIQRLPTVGRDPYEPLRLSVGITGDGARSGGAGFAGYPPNAAAGGVGQSNYGIFQTENQVQISAAGQRGTSNTYLIDGVSVDSLSHGGAAVITPSEEAVQQITVTATSYDAQYGRNVGVQVQTVTKSGSNQFHATGSFLYDEPGLNAYNDYGGPDQALLYRNQNKSRDYAIGIGGPILKDKLFFFVSYEGFTQTNTSFGNQWVETPQFDSLIQQDRPGSLAAAILGSGGIAPRVRQVLTSPGCNLYDIPQFNNNPSAYCQQLPGGGLDIGSPIGTTGTYVPIGTQPNPNVGNAYIGGGFDGVPDIEYIQASVPSHARGNQYHGRIDYFLTPRDQIFGSVFFSKLDQLGSDVGTGARPDSDVPFKPFNHSGTAAYIHTFSANLLNELRANYTRFTDDGVKDALGATNWGIPRIGIQDFPSGEQVQMGAPQASTTPAILAQNTYELRDMVTKVIGTHTLRFGGQFRWEQDNNNLLGDNRPLYNFWLPWNFANDTPIFEQITANPDTGGAALTTRYFRSHDFAGFLQHDWKATPTLTLNTGIRWEYYSPLANKGFRINQPVFGTEDGYLTTATLQPVNHIFDADYHNWAPKFGFARTPEKFNSKLVLRGGFGMSYDRFDDILFANSGENGPGYFFYNSCCGTAPTDFGTPYAGGTISYVLGTSSSPTSYPVNPGLATGVNPNTGTPNSFGGATQQVETYGAFKDTPNPYLYSYSLETQMELPYQMVGTIGYQGSVGHKFIRLVNQNFLHAGQTGTCPPTCIQGQNQTPFFASYIPTPDVYTNYNGVNLHLSKRYNRGFLVDVIYTYSKSMDQLSAAGPGSESNQTDPAHPATEYGPSDFDNRHRVIVNGLWDLPKYHGGHGLVGAILSGWQANGIFTYHTGFPWTPVTAKLSTTAIVTSAATLSPVRPLSYAGGAVTGCNNDLYIAGSDFPNKTGTTGGLNYFQTTPIPVNYVPGIGRNSFRGPCYINTDMSFAKQVNFNALKREANIRFQANLYNIFNTTNLQPFTFGSNETTVENPDFGLAPGSDQGRVIEFTAKFEF
jgi:hypothetical protein